jgi:hypothetical protein
VKTINGALGLIVLFFSSCIAFHTGNVSTGQHIDCPLMCIATGKSNTLKIFGIGGLNKEALILEAKKDLYMKFPYQKGIKLSNFSVDFKDSYVFFVNKTTATVSADVYNCNILEIDTLPINGIYGFNVGDSVYCDFNDGNAPIKGYLKASDDYETARVVLYKQIYDGYSEYAEMGIPYKKLFKATKAPQNINYFGFDIGEKVMTTIIEDEKNKVVVCEIIGINMDMALVSCANSKNLKSSRVIDKQLLRKM